MANLIQRIAARIAGGKGSKSDVEFGHSGTQIFGGLINEEFNPDLQFPRSIEVYDEMRRSDATVEAILEAIKMPLLAAEWFIRKGSEDKRDVEVAEFVHDNLFNFVDWNCWLSEQLGYLDFGFWYSEKIWEILPDDHPKYPGAVVWKRFASRIPAAHYLWTTKDRANYVDGHPAGVTQRVIGVSDESQGDEKKASENQPTIPWNKLILFTRRREGNNFEGISVLRAAYKHWFFKNLLYKVSLISAERFGAGIPYAKHKKGMGDAAKTKLDEMLKNMKSNEQSYARFSTDVEEWGIKTPDGDPKSAAINDGINHHDRKIYDAILAGFLNLSTGDGGSNALSKDQSSFFLKALQSTADYIISVMNKHIKELVDKNYQNVVNYPTLQVNDIGVISMDEAITSIVAATGAEILQLNSDDEVAIRKMLKLPEAPPVDDEDKELNRMEAELSVLEAELEEADDEEEPEEGAEGEEKPQEEEPEEKTEEPPTEKELSEFLGSFLGGKVYEFVAKGGHLDEATKKKIGDALRKKSGDTLKNELKGDKKTQQLTQTKDRIKAKIASLRQTLKDFKAKSRGMDRKSKRAFNKAMKNTIEVIKRQKQGLIQGRISTNVKLKARKGEVRTARKERKTKERIDKAIAREEKRRTRVSKRVDRLRDRLSRAKDGGARSRIQQQIKNAQAEFDKEFNEDEIDTIFLCCLGEIDVILEEEREGLKKKPLIPKPREKAFTANIGEFETFLESEYQKVLTVVEKAEVKYRAGLTAIYKSSETERIDGVVSLKFSKKQERKATKFVDDITAKLETALLNSPFQRKLFNTTATMAVNTMKANEKLLAEITVDQGRFNSFMSGYTSNIKGVLFNEPRKIKEEIVLAFGNSTALNLAIEQAGAIKFNRNILRLSTVTHAQAAYQGIIYGQASKDGFTFYKIVVPPNKAKDVAPSGRTASVLFLIAAAAVINKRISEGTDGKNADAVKGLGLHHGSFEYYYPIDSLELEEEEAIAREQRRLFLEAQK